jgi:L-lactate utilization protein LutC
LLLGDAERIAEQITNTERIIHHEVQEFEKRHHVEQREEENKVGITHSEAGAAEGGQHMESSSPRVDESGTMYPTSSISAPESSHGHIAVEKDSLEENGEVVVERDEDTVIY